MKNYAILAQSLKETLRKASTWETLSPEEREGLDLILMKVAEILGTPKEDPDPWESISHYASVVVKNLYR